MQARFGIRAPGFRQQACLGAGAGTGFAQLTDIAQTEAELRERVRVIAGTPPGGLRGVPMSPRRW